MFALRSEMYAVKRFLCQNKGMVISFDKTGVSADLNIRNEIVHKCLKTLTSKEYLSKVGNWRHAWYFVTEDGERRLKEEVGLPNEGRMEEQLEIKN